MDLVDLFSIEMERLAFTSRLILDGTKVSTHPQYPEAIHPLDCRILQYNTDGDCRGA